MIYVTGLCPLNVLLKPVFLSKHTESVLARLNVPEITPTSLRTYNAKSTESKSLRRQYFYREYASGNHPYSLVFCISV